MRFDILTLFPELFTPFLESGVTRRAYSSGTPAIGVGAGNVPVIIDETADLADAARKICASKTFDNATSCSSENAVVIVSSVYDAAIAALEKADAILEGR